MVAPLTIGPGIDIGGGVTVGTSTFLITSRGQNVTGSASSTGFFFRMLNRGYPGWDTFAATGNNGQWTGTGDFGSGVPTTVPVVSVGTNLDDSVFPVVNGVQFQSGSYYTFKTLI
jgi:hypothetical protein